MNTERINWDFEHHPPSGPEAVAAHQQLRDVLRNAALVVDGILPDCREKSLAVTHLETALMWANAGIARNPRPEGTK